MWLVVHGVDNDVARVTPTGQVDEFELEDIEQLSGIAAGPEGRIWVTATGKVASFSPADPKTSGEVFTINDVTSNAPIVAGPDGQMWVAGKQQRRPLLPGGPRKHARLVRGRRAPGQRHRCRRLPDCRCRHRQTPDRDPDHGRRRPAGHPDRPRRGGRIAGRRGRPDIGPDRILRPRSQSREHRSGHAAATRPRSSNATATHSASPTGSDGAFWFALFGGAAQPGVERMTTTGEHTYLGGLKPGFGARQIAAGPGNTMWMTAENNEKSEYEVVRISGLEPPVVPISGGAKPKAPETKIGKGPKKTVKTRGKKREGHLQIQLLDRRGEIRMRPGDDQERQESAEAEVQGLQVAEEAEPEAGQVPLQRPRRRLRRRRPLTGGENLQGRSRQGLSRLRSVSWTIGIVRFALAASRR